MIIMRGLLINIKSILFFITICFVVVLISACNVSSSDYSRDSSENIYMKDGEFMLGNVLLYKAGEYKRADYIEEKVLKKLKNITVPEKGKDRDGQFKSLLYESAFSLGTKTLDFLEGLKIRDDEFGIKEVMRIIRDRLQMAAMLQNYLPKNELEAKIVNRIKFYSPTVERNCWLDDESRNVGSKMAFPMLKVLKIGPLNDGKYVYVKCHGFEDEISNKGEIDSFQASAAENGCRKFGYSLGEIYVISLENSDRGRVGFEK